MSAGITGSEQWRPVMGYEGSYEVSDHGRVRSVPRRNARGRSIAGRVLKPGPDSGGYSTYNLFADGHGRTYRGHHLVMLAFVGARPSGEEIRHLDGDPANNMLANLCYGTPTENADDRVRHGTHHHARKTHCPKGHPYSGDNLGVTRRGERMGRFCLACRRDRKAQRRRASGVAPRGPKAHCPQGHPYDAENTYIAPSGTRNCRACRRAASRTWHARAKRGALL